MVSCFLLLFFAYHMWDRWFYLRNLKLAMQLKNELRKEEEKKKVGPCAASRFAFLAPMWIVNLGLWLKGPLFLFCFCYLHHNIFFFNKC